jgi:hypothetical protein
LDGLDECFDRKQQEQILQLFMEAIQTNHLPIRLMLCSRPEPQLRTVLESKETTPLYRSLVLTADRSAYKDIRKYLVAEFSRINSKFSRLGVHLGEAWPDEDALNRLVEKSSGIFIYASTVIRFIDDEYSHPADRLASVLALEPDSTAPLDALYTEILSVLPQQDHVPLRLMHALLHPRWRLRWQELPEDLDLIFGLTSGRSRLVLGGLRSLLNVPPLKIPYYKESRLPWSTPSLHASFTDYLLDKRRSEKWYIGKYWLCLELVKSIVRFLSNPVYSSRHFLYRYVTSRT